MTLVESSNIDWHELKRFRFTGVNLVQGNNFIYRLAMFYDSGGAMVKKIAYFMCQLIGIIVMLIG